MKWQFTDCVRKATGSRMMLATPCLRSRPKPLHLGSAQWDMLLLPTLQLSPEEIQHLKYLMSFWLRPEKLAPGAVAPLIKPLGRIERVRTLRGYVNQEIYLVIHADYLVLDGDGLTKSQPHYAAGDPGNSTDLYDVDHLTTDGRIGSEWYGPGLSSHSSR